jgi:hypothetical protein
MPFEVRGERVGNDLQILVDMRSLLFEHGARRSINFVDEAKALVIQVLDDVERLGDDGSCNVVKVCARRRHNLLVNVYTMESTAEVSEDENGHEVDEVGFGEILAKGEEVVDEDDVEAGGPVERTRP